MNYLLTSQCMRLSVETVQLHSVLYCTYIEIGSEVYKSIDPEKVSDAYCSHVTYSLHTVGFRVRRARHGLVASARQWCPSRRACRRETVMCLVEWGVLLISPRVCNAGSLVLLLWARPGPERLRVRRLACSFQHLHGLTVAIE